MPEQRRTAFRPEVRAAVRAKTDGICAICGCPLLEPDRFAIDHIAARHGGGTDDLVNLQPAHERCNLMKSKRDLPGWKTPATATGAVKSGGAIYNRAFHFTRYVETMRRNGSNPFVRVKEAPDGGRFISGMDRDQTAELLHHGACLTNQAGLVLPTGAGAEYFIWPHVAARGARYNGGVYSLICPAKADLARFGQNRFKGEDETRRRVEEAAGLWLSEPSCQWPCARAAAFLAMGSRYQGEAQ